MLLMILISGRFFALTLWSFWWRVQMFVRLLFFALFHLFELGWALWSVLLLLMVDPCQYMLLFLFCELSLEILYCAPVQLGQSQISLGRWLQLKFSCSGKTWCYVRSLLLSQNRLELEITGYFTRPDGRVIRQGSHFSVLHLYFMFLLVGIVIIVIVWVLTKHIVLISHHISIMHLQV